MVSAARCCEPSRDGDGAPESAPSGPWPSPMLDPGGYLQRLILGAVDQRDWMTKNLEEDDPHDAYSKFFDVLGAVFTSYLSNHPDRRDRRCVRENGHFDLTRVPVVVLLASVALLSENECLAIIDLMEPGYGPSDASDKELMLDVVSMAGCPDTCEQFYLGDSADGSDLGCERGLATDPWFVATMPHRTFVRELRGVLDAGDGVPHPELLASWPATGVSLPPAWPDPDGSQFVTLEDGRRDPSRSIN